MSFEGTVVNGAIVLDGSPALPEGARVSVVLTDDEVDYDPPPPTETYEEHLAILRQSIADSKAGVGGMTVQESMTELDIELQRLADAEGPTP